MTPAPPVATHSITAGHGASSLTAPRQAWLREAWRMAAEAGASDLHLVSGQPPCMRVNGHLQVMALPPCPPPPWTVPDTVTAFAGAGSSSDTGRGADSEGCLHDPLLGRARWSLARQQLGAMLVLRLLPAGPPTPAQAGLPDTLTALMDRHDGLVLVSGPTGSGKSSTLAALAMHWRQRQRGHLLTLEDPVEFLHAPDPTLGVVSQREIGRDCTSFADGLRASLRQDPDAIVIGELRDADTAALALAAATTGHLVMATVHAASAAGTVDRLLGLLPATPQSRAQLADALTAVVSQRLLAHGNGRRACHEVLMATQAVRRLIREHQLDQLASVMQTGGADGMQTREQALARLRTED